MVPIRFFAITFVLAISICSADAQITLRCEAPPENGLAAAFRELSESANKKDLGFKIELLPSNSVVPPWGMAAAVQKGTLACGIASTLSLAQVEEGFKVFHAPFQFDNFIQVAEFESGKAGQLLVTTLQKKGIELLAYLPGEFSGIFANKPLTDTNSFKGLKIGGTMAATSKDTFMAIGAIGVTLAERDIAPAIQMGLVDAYAGPLSTFTKLFGKKTVTVTKHLYVGNALIFNRENWLLMPPKVQEAVRAIASALGKSANVETVKLYDTTEASLLKSDVRIIQLNSTIKSEWRKSALTSFSKGLSVNEKNAVWMTFDNTAGGGCTPICRGPRGTCCNGTCKESCLGISFAPR